MKNKNSLTVQPLVRLPLLQKYWATTVIFIEIFSPYIARPLAKRKYHYFAKNDDRNVVRIVGGEVTKSKK